MQTHGSEQVRKRPEAISVAALVMLWLAVMVSALAVIDSTHKSRIRLAELEALRKDASDLQVMWGQYLLEHSTLAAYSRVEQLARDQLRMEIPKQSQIVVVQP